MALLVDATATVGARIENSGEVGFLNGTGDPRVLELQLLDPFAPAQVGDRLVSFGVRGGAYVPGIPLGHDHRGRRHARASSRASRRWRRSSTSRPSTWSASSRRRPRTDPRDAVLPPKPTTSPDARPERQRRSVAERHALARRAS